MLSDLELASALSHDRVHRVFRYKFDASLVELIVRQLKYSTWRLDWDELPKPGDHVYMGLSPDGQLFCFGVAGEVFVKRWGDLTEEERRGHEEYPDRESGVATFEAYYPHRRGKIGPTTELAVVKFHPILFALDNDWNPGIRPGHTVYVEVDW